MDLNPTNDFRVLLNVILDNEPYTKCFIFIKQKKMKLIKDVEEHAKSILGLNSVSFYINDAWLPSNETVRIIKEDDILTAKAANNEKFDTINANLFLDGEYYCESKKRKVVDNSSAISVELLYKELNEKKINLENKTNRISDAAVTEVNELDVIEETVPQSFKKKRIRKHKKKGNRDISHLDQSNVKESSSKTEVKEINLPYFGRHTRFDDVAKNNSEQLNDNVEKDETAEITEETKLYNETMEISPGKERDDSSLIANKNDSSHLTDVPDPSIPNCLTESDGIINSKDEIEENGIEGNTSGYSPVDKDNEDDWRTRLLILAQSKEVPLKVFHRKQQVSHESA